MSRRNGVLLAIAVVFVIAAVAACRKPARILLTKDQQARIGENLLKQAPAPKFKSGANFGDNIRLVGMDIAPEQIRAGQEISLTYYWECLRPTAGDWKVFGHLELPGGKRMILDHVPVGELYPISQWKQGEIIKDVQKVTVDPESKAGSAVLWAGLFSEEIYRERGGGDRMPLVNKDQVQNDGDNRVRVASFAVQGKEAASRGPALIKAQRISSSLVIDGRLDGADWSSAPAVTLNDASGRAADPKALTTVRAVWDESNLYLMFQCLDGDIDSPYKNRDDELWNRDAVEVYLDAGADGKDYLELQVSPGNVSFDARFDTRRQPEWQKAKNFNLQGLQTAVSLNGTLNDSSDEDTGYDVEIAVPWSSIPGWTKMPPKGGDEIRVNFFRIESKDGKVTGAQAFAPAGGDFHDLEKAGTLRLFPTAAEGEVRKDLPADNVQPPPAAGKAVELKVNPGLMRSVQMQDRSQGAVPSSRVLSPKPIPSTGQ